MHYRALRQADVWLSKFSAKKLDDFYEADDAHLLHAHSIDAAQKAFYKACQTTKANQAGGAHYPRQRKFYRTTIWKNSGIRVQDGRLLLARACGREPITVNRPPDLAGLPADAFREMWRCTTKSAAVMRGIW
jgi:hypothetical protein